MNKQRIATLALLLLAIGTAHVATLFQISQRSSGEERLLSEEERRSQILEQGRRDLLARMESRRRIVHALAAGKMSFLEAAACFRDLNEGVPELIEDVLRQRYPECNTDDERHCRQLIDFAQICLTGDARQATVVARMRQELKAHQQRGPVLLPR